MTPPSQLLGLIAGNGHFPILFARKAKSLNYQVVAVAIKGDTSWWLRFFVDDIHWVAAGELKKLFEIFKKSGVRQVIMAGQVNPNNLFDSRFAPDAEFSKLFDAMQNRKADTIFAAIGDRLRDHQIELVDSTFLMKEYLAPKGTLTRRAPSLEELTDIEFGFEIAKSMGEIDVGQTVVVRNKAIVAVEAMEGTDQAILRGGRIARGGAVVVKTAKPKQDNRFDVPVVGPRTIKNMLRSQAKCLAVESGKTLIIDRDRCVKMADQAGICIVAA